MSKKGYTLSQLAELTQAELIGNPEDQISSVASLEDATQSDASFLANKRYTEAMLSSKAGVICIDRHTPSSEKGNYFISNDPSATFQKIAQLFFPKAISTFAGKIHPTAIIDPSAKIGKDVTIGPYVVIDRNVTVGDRTTISPSVTIGPEVSIGTHCLLHPNVVIRERCKLGSRVIIQPGAIIGSCGFGYLIDERGHHIKLDQLGIVVIEDDVEIGANTTIDRARFKQTRISRGTKIDNLVQIAHNVNIGEDNIIISQSGIAGSTSTGKHVYFAGQVGVVGHVKITDNVMIASKSGISKSIDVPGKYSGIPVLPLRKHNEVHVHLRNISTYVKKLRELEQTVQELTEQLSTTKN